MTDEKIVLEFKNISLIALLVILGAFFVLELQVTFPSPITFGDEAYHTGMARYIAKEVDYPKWTMIQGTEAGRVDFGKPPMFNLLMAGFFFVFGFNEAIAKFLVPFISILTALAIYLIVKKLYDEKIGFIAAIVYASIPSVATYSVTFYTEILVTLYFALSALLLIYSIKTGNKKYAVLTAMFAAFAFLSEISSLALLAFIFLASLYVVFTNRNMQLGRYMILIVLFIALIGGFLIRNFSLYNSIGCYLDLGIDFIDRFNDRSGCNYRTQEIEQKFQYEGIRGQAGSDQSVYKMGITNFLDFSYGNIWLVPLGMFGGLVIAFYRRDVSSILLIFVMLMFVPYFHPTAARAEDAARNLLAWTPFFAIFTGIYFGRVYELLQSHQKYIAVVIFLIVIILAYQNLAPKLEIMKKVKQFSPAFFEACDWVNKNLPKDAVLSTIWVYRAAYSCERSAVGNPADIFLSNDVDLIKKTAKEVGITHLFIQKFSLGNAAVSEVYKIDTVRFFEDNKEHFPKVYENGPSLEQCIQQGGCDGNILYEVV